MVKLCDVWGICFFVNVVSGWILFNIFGLKVFIWWISLVEGDIINYIIIRVIISYIINNIVNFIINNIINSIINNIINFIIIYWWEVDIMF